MVLTGGSSTRLGRDKATEVVSGRRMIDRILSQIPAEVPVVVVGPDPAVVREVVVTREDPPGGGPAAAIAAGAGLVHTELVAVVAADMPFAVPMAISLLTRLGRADAVVPLAHDQPQPLCAVYRTQAVRDTNVTGGTSMRAFLEGLEVTYVAAEPGSFLDIDTPADVREAGRRLAIMETETKGHGMQEWVAAVKEALELDTDVDVGLILDVAKDAAHGVQRPAAPVTTYLLGLAVGSGADPVGAAAKLAALAEGWQGQPGPDA